MEMKHSFGDLLGEFDSRLPVFDDFFTLGRFEERRQGSSAYEVRHESIMSGNGAESYKTQDVVMRFDSEENRRFLLKHFVFSATKHDYLIKFKNVYSLLRSSLFEVVEQFHRNGPLNSSFLQRRFVHFAVASSADKILFFVVDKLVSFNLKVRFQKCFLIRH